jgi:hypothetical protein
LEIVSHFVCSVSFSPIEHGIFIFFRNAASNKQTGGEVTDFPTEKFAPYRVAAGDTTRRAFSYLVVGGIGVGLLSSVKSIAVRTPTQRKNRAKKNTDATINERRF